MAWECIFQKDGDKDDVGVARASFLVTTSAGDEVDFSYTRRIDGKKDAASFVQEAKDAKTKNDNDEIKNNTLATAIQNLLNT